MPISQDRMVALIRAGSDFEQAGNRVMQALRNALNGLESTNDYKQFGLEIETICDIDPWLKQPTTSRVILAEERRHFAKSYADNYRRNARRVLGKKLEGNPAPAPNPRNLRIEALARGESMHDVKIEKKPSIEDQLESIQMLVDGKTQEDLNKEHENARDAYNESGYEPKMRGRRSKKEQINQYDTATQADIDREKLGIQEEPDSIDF